MDFLQAATTGTAVAAFIGVIATWVRQRPAMKLAEIQGEAALWKRIEKLEAEAKAERKSCDERIGRLEERHAAAIAEVRKELNGEVQILRHDRNNTRTVLNFLLSQIKKIDHPALREVAAEAEAMLARGEDLVALEKGAMAGVQALGGKAA